MKDISRVNLTNGAQVFEYNGMAYYRYNASIKVAGDSVKVCFYEKGILSGWSKHKRQVDDDSDKKIYEYDPEKKWFRTGLNARRRLYDFVAANIGKHLDHNGKKQTFKFVTYTFRDDIKKLDEANKLFKNGMDRLNYHFTGDTAGRFLEYAAVPELQMEKDRYVWHYHVIFFNLPYIPVSADIVEDGIRDGRFKPDYDKRNTLFYLWGEGGVKVNAVKLSDVHDIAGYVCKYMGKGLNDLYEYAKEMGNLNRKRFLHSTGLFGPKLMIAFLNKQQRQEIANFFKAHCKKFKKKGELGKYYETFSVDNEFIGKLFGINFRSPKKHIEKLEGMFDRYSYGFC
ncbi:MAG TPA: hypothetical protein VEA58_12270 [Anaerovoracaceae bacterium]|nr:hypothetical protein [Anaerovoracaceae bacterium]